LYESNGEKRQEKEGQQKSSSQSSPTLVKYAKSLIENKYERQSLIRMMNALIAMMMMMLLLLLLLLLIVIHSCCKL
jgi:hypothetical protein